MSYGPWRCIVCALFERSSFESRLQTYFSFYSCFLLSFRRTVVVMLSVLTIATSFCIVIRNDFVPCPSHISCINSSVFCVITLRKVVLNRRFGTNSHIFNGKVVQEESLCFWTAWHVKVGLTGSPETSVFNHLTPRNNPEDGRIQFNREGSLISCMSSVGYDGGSVNVCLSTGSSV